jgi:phosphate transport system permease protein
MAQFAVPPTVPSPRRPADIAAHAVPASALARALRNRVFLGLCLACTALAVATLAVLLVTIWNEGHGSLSWDFLGRFASRKAADAGIKAPLWGSIWVCAVCALSALPIGVGTAIYLEEFAPKSRLTRFISINISNLAGVPSIVYGILGLTAFVRLFGLANADSPIEVGNPESFLFLRLPFGSGVLSGGLTLMLVVLPIIIVSSREALRSVPRSLRAGSLALGATTWQTTWNITLPASIPMIMTGAILAMSRAIGEAAATDRPASALSSELLPAFGGPMMATVGASIRRCRRRERSASPGPGAPCMRQRSGCASSRGIARSLAARGSVASMRSATGSALAAFQMVPTSVKRAPRASRRSVHSCRRRGPPCGVTSRLRSSTRSSSASSRPAA